VGGFGQLAQAVGLTHPLLDAEVQHREHVEPAEAEHHKHLRRPHDDSTHGGERRDDGFVR
jgi:hypothetical protein